MKERKIEILIDNKNISAFELPSGGTKTVYNIGDGYVIARMGGWEELIDSEIHMAKKLEQLGLYTQDYEKIMAFIDDHAEPVLKMKNFTTLVTEGRQVRDCKNQASSCGDTLIFDDMDHLKDQAHWHRVLKHIADDIYLYLINNFEFGSDAFNLIIVDTEKTAAARHNTTSKLFSDLKQEIHLYFFDFGSSVYKERKNYHFIDAKGEIRIKNIRDCIDYLSTKITYSLFHSVLDSEFKKIMQKSPGCMMIIELMEASKNVFQSVWQELVEDVSVRIKSHLENMTIQERKERYLTPLMQEIGEKEAKCDEILRKINEENHKLRIKIEQDNAKYELWRQEKLAEQARLDEIKKQFQKVEEKIETNNEFEDKKNIVTENPKAGYRCSIQ